MPISIYSEVQYHSTTQYSIAYTYSGSINCRFLTTQVHSFQNLNSLCCKTTGTTNNLVTYEVEVVKIAFAMKLERGIKVRVSKVVADHNEDKHRWVNSTSIFLLLRTNSSGPQQFVKVKNNKSLTFISSSQVAIYFKLKSWIHFYAIMNLLQLSENNFSKNRPCIL